MIKRAAPRWIKNLFRPPTVPSLADRIQLRVGELVNALKPITRMAVHSGPFAGMRLLEQTSWSDLGSKLLGTYESELCPAINETLELCPDCIIHVGCSEGYYAVGLARLLPEAMTYAFDIDPLARQLCATAAEVNGVACRVHVGGRCTRNDLNRLLAKAKRSFMLVDCEGGERDLLLEEGPNLLSQTHLLVECHDFIDPTITSNLLQKFRTSHSIEKIEQGARNPHTFSALRSWSEIDKWLLVSENRPVLMHWLWMKPLR